MGLLRRPRRSPASPAPSYESAAVTGVDGCAGGWVAVTLGPVGPSTESPVTGTAEASGLLTVSVAVAATLDGLSLTGVTGIDMPLGLLSAGWRDADLLARRALGRRGVTVFAIPPRPVWECETYAEANQACRELTGKGLSVQAWGLRRKIAEADEFRRAATAPGSVHLYEVHPGAVVRGHGGRAAAGQQAHPGRTGHPPRVARQAGIALPLRITGAGEDDLLDAAAVAWSARRIAAGEAVALTSPGQRADDGAEIAIRY